MDDIPSKPINMAQPGLRSRSPFLRFLTSDKAGGIILIACTMLSLLVANSPAGSAYHHFWQWPLPVTVGPVSIPFNLEEWINDGLMAIFFLLVGLEIKKEMLDGELSGIKKALLPVMAAVGGMALPALIHFLLNHGKAGQPGIGIPMATDIAFSLGILSLLGSRIPVSLKIFLTALAIIDDLGAILVIALFYTSSFSAAYLFAALGLFGGLLLLNRLKVTTGWIYLLTGVVIWYCMYKSGIHATLSGVLLAFAIPVSKSAKESMSHRLEHAIHYPVNLLIVPVFALANTAIFLPADWHITLFSANSLGIGLGLLLGKPLGIGLASLCAVKLGWSVLPPGLTMKRIFGLGLLAGIGFTMSIFISNLAFADQPAIIEQSKIVVLLTSGLAAIAGAGCLTVFTKKTV